MRQTDLPESVRETITQILARGNTVEVKMVQGQIQVIEISRKLKIKAPTIG